MKSTASASYTGEQKFLKYFVVSFLQAIDGVQEFVIGSTHFIMYWIQPSL